MNLTSRLRSLVLPCVALGGLLVAGTARADLVTGSEDVSGSRSTAEYTIGPKTYGPYGWDYSYTRSFDGNVLNKHLEINLVFDDNIPGLTTVAEMDAYKAAAKANIEAQWNNKYAITDNNTGTSYPITFTVTTDGPFNQTVYVHESTGPDDPTDMTNWYSQETAKGQAHEFGHMLGLYDEYLGGAVNQYPNPLISDDGLMGLGALAEYAVMYPRYYQQFLDYMDTLNPDNPGGFTLTAVPEPSTFVLLGLGAAALVVARRRSRRAA